MTRRSRVILVALVGVIALPAVYALRPREPVYQGKRLTEWLAELDSWLGETDSPAMNAVRRIGTNALPKLSRMIVAQDSPLKHKLIELSYRQSLIKLDVGWAGDLNRRAIAGYYALGGQAKSAVPDLVALIQTPNPTPLYYQAIMALAAIGPEAKEAIPVLIECLNRKGFEEFRALTTYALGRIGPEAAAAVPSLTTMLAGKDDYHRLTAVFALARISPTTNTDITPLIRELKANKGRQLRSDAAHYLGELGVGARTAVPALLEAFNNDPDGMVKGRSYVALNKITDASISIWLVEGRSQPAVDFLNGTTNPEDWRVRFITAYRLGERGGAARVAVPALVERLKDENSTVRESAADALKKIDPEAAAKARIK